MIRSGMGNLINQVRSLTAVTSSDINDEEIQRILDRNRQVFLRYGILPQPKYINQSMQYLDYYIGDPPLDIEENILESNNANLSGWRLYNSRGIDIASNLYSVDYNQGIISFTVDQRGAAIYLDFRQYDLYRAAVEVLQEWIAKNKGQFTFTSDGQMFARNQKIQNVQALIKEYNRKTRPRNTHILVS